MNTNQTQSDQHKSTKNKFAAFIYQSQWLLFIFLFMLIMVACSSENKKQTQEWPEITSQVKPWARWWWMGDAVDKENISYQLEAFAKAGLGGVEITPIYGVKGYEDKFIQYLSPEWLDMLDHTLTEANRLGLQVDMIMGTGWPYGGPQVEPEFAASKITIQKYQLKAGEPFSQEISINDPKQQNLAELQNVLYYDKNDGKVDLTPLLVDGHLTFTASCDIELYALFCAKTRQRVKRSAPGGEGYTLDHFSNIAFNDYCQPFDTALVSDHNRLRAIFNDSYEVYGADFSPIMVAEFQRRRNYDLLDYLPLIDQKPDNETYYRFLCDYRETLSDMLLQNFTENWTNWAHRNTFKTKLQAHGSPGNLIDLYAAADIPECEVFGSPQFDIPGYRRDSNNVRIGDNNKMMLKFCSSAAHLKGSELVSSESFTWLREHFKAALSQAKPVADDFLLSGVNHIFLHGSTYSPKEAPWPGWKFYASVNFNPTNSIWADAPYLFDYIARCQSLLQKAKTDNEVLVYWPIYDAYTHANSHSLLQQYSLHSIDEWLINTSFYNIASELDSTGFGFDFISDQFILQAEANNNQIKVSANAKYKTLIVPEMESIPLSTMNKLIELKQKGASIIFMGEPQKVPGLFQYEKQEEQLRQLIRNNMGWMTNPKPLQVQLNELGIFGEKASETGLKILRKELDGSKLYFVANHTANEVNGYIPFNAKAQSVLMMDPMTGHTGLAEIKTTNNGTDIKIDLKPGQTVFLKTNQKTIEASPWKYQTRSDKPIALNNPWSIEFIEGGPILPNPIILDSLHSWTDLDGDYENFSGTSKYSTTFQVENPNASGWMLNLGDVRESARVFLNGEFIGAVFAHPFQIDLSGKVKTGDNKLVIEVTNLSANRIRFLEKSGVEWKIFYEINMVNIHYQPFDAASWDPVASGLISDVQLIPVYYNTTD